MGVRGQGCQGGQRSGGVRGVRGVRGQGGRGDWRNCPLSSDTVKTALLPPGCESLGFIDDSMNQMHLLVRTTVFVCIKQLVLKRRAEGVEGTVQRFTLKMQRHKHFVIRGQLHFFCHLLSSQCAHSFMAILTGDMQSGLPHGVFHVHVGHVLDQVVKELCSPVDCQPVDLQPELFTLFPPATAQLKSIRSMKVIDRYYHFTQFVEIFSPILICNYLSFISVFTYEWKLLADS